MSQTRAEHEKEKYDGIYANPERYKKYGHSNHGKHAVPLVANKMLAQSVLDVGCGYNEFNQSIRELKPELRTVGVDFSCPGADIICSAEKMPFADKEFDVLTAFDMLEHILEEQVDTILSEFARVSNRFVFSISYVPSVNTWKGENLHPCVHSEKWWIMRIMKAGGSRITKSGKYICGEWQATMLFMPPKANVLLVGNGPSILTANGKKIDSYDEVIRFNTYHTEPKFAKHTGTKTTIWSTFGKGTHEQMTERPDRVIYIHGEAGEYGYKAKEEYRLQRWFYNHVGDAVRTHREWLGGLYGDPWRPTPKRELIASSGLLVASWLLEVVGVEKLTLVGFDHFSKERSKQHHYWLPGPFGKPKEHDGDVEKVMFESLAKKGRIVYL